MSAHVLEHVIQTLEISKDEFIAAPIDIVFESLLEQMGPYNETPDGAPMPMKIEAWPGGRWFRDLGNNTGHYWGTVQSVKPPALLEIHGPMFMSAPVVSHLIYRLTTEEGGTRLKFSHRAFGEIAPEYIDGSRINAGWTFLVAKVRASAESKAKETKRPPSN
jgi:uncharacterized protein YndB with AHSA1/START domain